MRGRYQVRQLEKSDFPRLAALRQELAKQVVQMIDIVLDGYRTQLDKIPAGSKRRSAVMKEFEKDRLACILPLGKSTDFITKEKDDYQVSFLLAVNKGFLEEAGSLAEKYLEFVALIQICTRTNDQLRLERYMDQFAGQNFADFVFDWHVREGKQVQTIFMLILN